MRIQRTLRLLGSIACCAILGCQPNQSVSSTADNSGREVTPAQNSDEAGTPAPVGESGSAPAARAEEQDERPSLVTELPSASPTTNTGGAELPTEVRETFFPSGSTRRQWIVKILPNGTEVEHGESLRWHENGQPWVQGDYIDGVREGLWLSWHLNGSNRGEGRLHRDRRVGTWTTWHDNGQKRSEAAYEVGLAHGKSTTWDKDGNVLKTGTYARNKKHGTWIEYIDGEKTETEWINGVKVE